MTLYLISLFDNVVINKLGYIHSVVGNIVVFGTFSRNTPGGLQERHMRLIG